MNSKLDGLVATIPRSRATSTNSIRNHVFPQLIEESLEGALAVACSNVKPDNIAEASGSRRGRNRIAALELCHRISMWNLP